MEGVQITIDDPDYPEALRQLPNPPRRLTTSGPLTKGRAVAIVGSRRATPEAITFAYELAFELARAGVTVVSGGATGADAAAHRGAMAGGGATWVVSPTGKDRVYPPQHRELFAEVARSERSRMIWCFEDHEGQTTRSFHYRNGVLAALSEVLVVVQAHFKSGSRNATNVARSLDRPVWAVTAAPWMTDFAGSLSEIEHGRARPLCSAAQLFRALRLDRPSEVGPAAPPPEKHGRAPFSRGSRKAPPRPLATGSWSPEERLVFSILLPQPLHLDQIDERSALPAGSAATALLTLSLKDVVVEGPERFFRRKSVT
ncbi:DNA-processing protein DprA [soil metagenome]